MVLTSAAPNRRVFASFAVLLILLMLSCQALAVDSDYAVLNYMGITTAEVTRRVFALTVINMPGTVRASGTACTIA